MSYSGFTLDVNTVLRRVNHVANDQGFTVSPLTEQNGLIVPVLTRKSRMPDGPSIYLSTGIHGDEPGGPAAVLHLLENGALTQKVGWTIFPMLNPAGFELNQRENHQSIDLNHEYLNPETKEIVDHVNYIADQRGWDLALILHEDWESEGFYLYDLPQDLTVGWSERIIDRVSEHCPIDLTSEIDDMNATGGIISPKLDSVNRNRKLQGKWPETVFMIEKRKVHGTFTFEAPSVFDLQSRISALETATLTAVELLLSNKT